MYTARLISNTEFGNKLVLKSGTVLLSKLIEADRKEFIRKTYDIDIHCDKWETWCDFCSKIEKLLNSNNRGYVYKIVKRRSYLKPSNVSDSLVIELTDKSVNIKFKMDMNILSNTIITVEYSPILKMNTYDNYTMLSDKIVVVSSHKIYRRVKDLYDIMVIASVYDIDYMELVKHLLAKHGKAEIENMITNENYAEISHAYEKYSGINDKPRIELVIAIVGNFLAPIYRGYKGEMAWSCKLGKWIRH